MDENLPATICSTVPQYKKGSESRDLHRVGAGESSASTPTSFATSTNIKRTIV